MVSLTNPFRRTVPTGLIDPQEALPGRSQSAYGIPQQNVVLNSPLLGPWPQGVEVIYLGMGCFWGAEELYWTVPGVVGSSVGYLGGFTTYPTYEEVCTGRTGHAEVVCVAYRSDQVSTVEILRIFWEHHDPTQGNRQGNDIGTQYRSAIYTTNDEQLAVALRTRDVFEATLRAAGLPAITTQIEPLGEQIYYPAEDYHQQYLHKVPHGYRCHATTGMRLPAIIDSAVDQTAR
jgi:peptide-methionine (S)-S-oxide reductase